MQGYRPTPPLKIKEIITPTNFIDDLDLVERVVNEKMLRAYVTILFICSLILTFVVIV